MGKHASVSRYDHALSALLFFYRERLTIDLPWLTEVRIRYGLSGFRRC